VRWPNLACGLVLVVAACGTESEALAPPRDPNDIDGDGIPNDADLCPTTYDPEQHDEDLDGIGDACDVCPSLADDQADTGETGSNQFGDGIGDACDPRPNRDGDRRVQFDAFATDISATRWSGDGFTIENDAAHATGDARFHHVQPVQGDGLFAQIHVTSLVWTKAGRVEAIVDGDGINGGFSCAVVRDTDADGNDEIEAREIGAETMRSSLGRAVTADLTITAWRAIGFDRTGKFFCRVRHGGGTERELALILADPFPSGPYAFASSGATTDIASIIVYTFPIGPCAFAAGRPDCSD
jgi:hypothetical protein